MRLLNGKKKVKKLFLLVIFLMIIKRVKIQKIKKKYFLSFVGSISNKYHFDRTLFLYDLNKKIKINFLQVTSNVYVNINLLFQFFS